ncbi:hypothetical protein LEGA110927_08025 [Leuconostoc gasicomitatum]|nr:hypothetical protein LGAA44_400042 [Leuconostoc gasicomitatum]
MSSIFAGILNIWAFFANNILTQPAYMIGFIVLIGYQFSTNINGFERPISPNSHSD